MRSALVNSPAGAQLSLWGIQTSRPQSPAHACGPAPGLCTRVVRGAASLAGAASFRGSLRGTAFSAGKVLLGCCEKLFILPETPNQLRIHALCIKG